MAALIAAGPAFAQVSSGSFSSPPSSSPSSVFSPPTPSSFGAAGTISPQLETGRAATSVTVPNPALAPNGQVAPSAAGLPGGASQIPYAPGSDAGSAIPVWGTQDASVPSVSGSINESASRSLSTDCTGTGLRSSSGSGSTSVTTSNCARGLGFGTLNIMGSGSAIDVGGN